MWGELPGRAGSAARALPPPVLLCIAAWVAGLATTALVVLAPNWLSWSRSPSTRLLLSTADVCAALLVAYLLLGRFLRLHRVRDLLLAGALAALAGANVVAELVPALAPGTSADPFIDWSALLVRVTAAGLVLASVLVGADRRLTRRNRPLALVPVPAVAAALVLLWTQRRDLPAAVEIDVVRSGLPVLDGHALLLAGQATGALAFTIASFAYTRQAVRRHDDLVLWAGPAFALAACARLSYAAYPSLHTEWVHAGDVLRTAGYALLMVGAAREIGAYWHGFAGAAVLEDRRRLARELHDGVLQELSYLRAAASVVVPDPAARDDVVGACDRALDEARAAVDALGRHPDEPLALTLHRAAQQVAERYGGCVVVDLDDSIRCDQDRRHALVRITREAVGNAMRHGRARQVCVRLEQDHGTCRLFVEDDGCGFDPAASSRGAGYGLTSMRDRAQALPGTFELRSRPSRGTTVTVTWSPTATAAGGPSAPGRSTVDPRSRTGEVVR